MEYRTAHTISRNVLSTLLVVATAASSARAEENAPLTPGQRLRVTASSPAFTGVTVGNLVKIGSDSLTLVDAERGSVTELPLSSVTRIEVGRQRRATRKGLLIGLGIGALGAIAISADNTASCGGYDEPLRACTSSEKVGLSALVLGVWGGGGAWLGHRKTSDVWSDTPVERFKVSVRPERGGGHVAFKFSF